MSEEIRVFLVDDHPAIREGIKTILGGYRGDQSISIAGEAGSAEEARRILPGSGANIILADISLPDGNGFDLVRVMTPLLPQGRFLILSMHLSAEYVIEALQAGAIGFLTKSTAGNELIHGIIAAHRGEYYLDPKSLGLLCERLGALPSSPLREADPAYSSLTEREREVFALIVSGKPLKEIASDCHLSVKTIENHKASIMKKLDASSLVDLFDQAERIGIRKPTPQ